MGNRLSGKSSDTKDDSPSHTTRRNNDEERSKQSRSGSMVSSSSNENPSARGDDQSLKSSRKSSSRGDDRDRGFNPTSTSYSSATQSSHPGTASASVAAASGNHNDEPYIPLGLVRNASHADKMPKSRSSRDERAKDDGRDPRNERRSYRDDNENDLDRDDHKREKRIKRDKKDKDRVKGSSRDTKSSRNGRGYGDSEGIETSRGPADFSDQVGASGFSQFPGQYNESMPNINGDSSEHPMSSHVQDQFPGQFPDQSAAPYRPPIAASEGGPGLAAEYYGDAGESVTEQPGNRANTPSLIVGAEPHLQAALAVAAPPPEPSASGGVGAAASFFSGEFDEHGSATSHSQETSTTFATALARPQGSHHASSAPAIPTVGGAAMGAAAGHSIVSQASSHTQRLDYAPSVGGAQQEHSSSPYQRPPSPTAESYYSNASRPQRPGKQSSQSSNVPLYAAGAVGAAGLGETAYQHGHQTFSPHTSSRPQNPMTPMAQRHRHHGPLGAVVNFFKDPDGVAEFEEYSEIIGVCKYCFAPGSSPKDAPRKHHYRRRRSNESLGRVDKESRYQFSENQRRQNKDKSWLATGLGLAKVGKSLFKQKNDFDDTYSVKTGRHSPDGRSQKSRRRSRSKDRIESGITSNGKMYKEDPQGGFSGGFTEGTYEPRRRSRSRSRSRQRKSSLADAANGATIGYSMAAPSPRHRRSASPKKALVKTGHRNGEHSPERRRKSHKKKKRGFFDISSASSSSSGVDIVHHSDRHRNTKRSTNKSKDDKRAEAAILGLGAAAAALALNDGRNDHKKKRVKELIGIKEPKGSRSRDSRYDHRSEDEIWESAPEDEYESADSALAYGGPRSKGSQESLSSDSSGTKKWGWRWGSKKKRMDSPAKRETSDHSNIPTTIGAPGSGLAGTATTSPDQYQGNGNDSNSTLPLQQVFPVPTSDPTRFDVGKEASVASSSSRPAVIPIQHPQPRTPVSAALCSSQPPYEHSYSAPTGPLVFSQIGYPAQPATGINARTARPEFATPGSFAQDNPHAKEQESNLKLRRRDSSPARFGDEAASSSMAFHRRASTKDDTSAVRFDRTEEQEENDRRERRQKRREDSQRREAEEQQQLDKKRRATTEDLKKKSDSGTRREESSKEISKTSWAAPAAAGIMSAAVGAAALAEKSESEETREERRERRRREREREEAEDQEATRKRERRRKERDREQKHDIDKSVGKEPQRILDENSQIGEDVDRQGRATEKVRSVWQEAASPKKYTTHEDYGAFFRPLDLDDSKNQAKVTSSNANADVDFDQNPAIVTVAPKGFRDPDAQPTYSPADTDDVVDTSRLSFPVPRLRLVEPTPPSSTGSTPIMRPRDTNDEDIEEPPRDHSPSKVTWGDDQTHEYTVNSPDEDYDRGQLIGSAAGETGNTGLEGESQPLDNSPLLSDKEHTNGSSNITESEDGPTSFSDDIEFAATLAASVEDAGFDPSIVIDDPMYRRRDSPPGTNDRSMPGCFDDDEISSLSRIDNKNKAREAKLRAESGEPNGPDDNAVVQDTVSQVENSDSRVPKKSLVDNLDDDDWGVGKKSKSKTPKKAHKKDSGFKDEFLESSESLIKPQEPENREIYEPLTKDTPSISPSDPYSNKGGSSRKSRKKSKRDSTGFNDTASAVSTPYTKGASGESTANTKKSSVWDRVLGRSPQEHGIKDMPDEAKMDEFEEPKKKSKKPKGRRPTRDEIDEDEIASNWSAIGERDNNQMGIGSSIDQDSGRITQDLPAKDRGSSRSTIREAGSISGYLEDHNGTKRIDEQRSESFLDMRPEPPPPPDKILREEEPPDPFATTDTRVSPGFLSEDQTPQYPQVLPSDPLPSPTAVPFDFPFSRPRPSIRSARSMSQMPPPSPHVTADLPPRTKPRSRSTEFKSSNEFGPLMFVKRHRSHQESAPEEAYPSLPSSRTTSRNSSVHDPEEYEHDQRDIYEMIESDHGPYEAGHGMAIDTGDSAVQSDLLDSQQATPTASSFQLPPPGHGGSPTPGSRGSSPQLTVDGHSSERSSIARDAVVHAVVEGAPTFALHKLTPDNDHPLQVLPQEEGQFIQGLDSMVLGQEINRSNGDKIVSSTTLTAQEGIDTLDKGYPKVGQAHFQQSLGDVASLADNTRTRDSSVVPETGLGLQEAVDLNSDWSKLPEKEEGSSLQYVEHVSPDIEAALAPEDDALPEGDLDPREDFTPQTTKKGKKSKRKPSKPNLPAEKAALFVTEYSKISIDTLPDPLSPEETRQIQEQDAQDAVDSWFAPTSSKKDKKKKRKGTSERLQEICEPIAPLAIPREILESAEPKDPQKGEQQLIGDMSSDQVVDVIASAAQSVENVEEDIPGPTTTPDPDAMASFLERRQSKSKTKKDKKGRKFALQGDASSLTSPGGNEVGFDEPFSEQLVHSAPHSPDPAIGSEDPEHVDERQGHSGIMLSPEEIPLPLDEDRDLLEQSRQDPEHANKRQGLSGIVLSPEEIPLPLDEDPDLLEQSRQDPEHVDERQGIPGIELSPEEIPLPLDEDRDLLEQSRQEPNVSPTSQLDRDGVIALSGLRSEALSIEDESNLPTAELPRELSNRQDKDVADDSYALPPTPIGKKGEQAEPSILKDVVMDVGIKDNAVPPEGSSDAAMQKQTQDSAGKPPGEITQELRVFEGEWAGFETQKKGKKGRNAKQSFVDDPLMQSGVLSSASVENIVRELAEDPVDEMSNESMAVEDERAGFSTKRKGKKGKQSKRNFTDDAGASADIRTETPIVSSTSQDEEEGVSQDPAGTIGVLNPQKESKKVIDDRAGFGGSEKAKESKRAKQSSSDDAETGAEVETGTPLPAATPKGAGDWQPQGLAGTVHAYTFQQGPNVIEDELTGSSDTKKGKKAKKIKQNFAVDDEKSADRRTGTALADATLEVVEDAKDESLIQQGNVNTFHEEPPAIEDESASFSSMNGKEKIEMNIVLDPQENIEIKPRSPTAVTTSEVVEDLQAGDVPFLDTGNTFQREPQNIEDEWAGSGSKKKGKKDKKRKSKTLYLDPQPLPKVAEAQGTEDIDSDPLAAPQATTSTSRDVAAIVEAAANYAPKGKESEESMLTSHQADHGLHKSITDDILDHTQRNLTTEANVGSTASDHKIPGLEVIDQYVDDQNLPKEETVDPEFREPETQVLEYVDQYGTEETIPPTLDSIAATTDTASAIQQILGDEVIPDTLSHEGAAAASPSVMHETPAADQALENAEPDREMPKKNKSIRSVQKEDPSFDEDKVNESAQAPTPSAEAEVPSIQDLAVEEPDWNMPKKKRGKKGRKESPMLDEPEADDSSLASIPPADAKIPLVLEPVTEVVDEFTSRKSKKDKKDKKDKKNKKKSLTMAPSDSEAALEGALGTPELPRDLEIVQEEALPAKTSPGTDLHGQKDFESSATEKPIQAFDTDDVLREGEPETFQELKPSKSKKEKKKAKKAKTLNLEDAGDAALMPKGKPLAELKSFKDDVEDQANSFDEKLVDELTENPEDRPKIKDGLNTTESLQPSSLESEGPTVPLEPVISHEDYQRIQEAQTEDLKENDPSRPYDPAIADDLEPPAHGDPNPESKGQPEEAAHEGASLTLPVFEQGPAASDYSEVRSKIFGANIDQPIEVAEHSSYDLKTAQKDEKQVNKACALTLNEDKTQQEPRAALEGSDAGKVEDDPSITPISEHRHDRSRQERSIEEIEPTAVVRPEGTPNKVQEHDDNDDRGITPPATKSPVDQPIEAGEDDYAPIQKGENGKKYTKERHSAFEPQIGLSIMKDVLGPSVAAGSERSGEMTAQEHPRDGTNASGERQSTLEASNLAMIAEPKPGEPSSGMENQETLGTKAEDVMWALPIKKEEKGKKSKKEKSLESVPEIERFPAELKQGTLTSVDPTEDERPPLEDQTPSNLGSFEEFGNAPSVPETDTRKPSALPKLQESINTKVEDEPWGPATKKGKKGKKSEKEKLSVFEPETYPKFTEATPVPTISAKSGLDDEPTVEEHPQRKPIVSQNVGEVDTFAEEESKEPLPALQTQDIAETKDEDGLWGMAIKKGKKGKRQRKDASKIQGGFEITDATSSGPPGAAQDSTDPRQDRRSITNTGVPNIAVPEDELLDPQEQRRYDEAYAWELERQGFDNPQSSNTELPTPGAHSEALDSQRHLGYHHNHAAEPERGTLEASHNATIDLPTPVQESEMQVSRETLQQRHKHGKDFEHRSPILDSPNPAAEPEQPDHSQQYPRDSELEESESSHIPTKELPTPAAEVVMLDAQEQREYDNEYAKELEKQLSPLQEGERSEPPADEARAVSKFQPSIDSLTENPYEGRMPLARPPVLEDIIEESRSRSGSVQGTPPNRKDDISPHGAPKKSKKGKKGKKGKKQQQSIIWEDDTATPPVESEANQVVEVQTGSSAMPGSWEPGVFDQPIDWEEPVEHRPVNESSSMSSTHIGLTKAPGEAEDYFAIQPSQHAEKDIGGNAEDDGFRRSLSTDFLSTDERLPEQKTHPSHREDEYTEQVLHGDQRTSPDSIGESYQPEVSTVPVNEEADENFNRAPKKKSKKGKKSKRREVERDPSPSMEDSEQALDQPQRSAIPTMESSGQTSAPQGHSPQRSSQGEGELLPGGDEPATGGHNIRDTEGVAATAALSAAAALAAEGLARRKSKKGNKKGKQGKGATRWADLEDETPESGSSGSKLEAVTDNAGYGKAPNQQSGIRAWHEDAEQTQTPEQESAVRSWQDSKGTPPQSPAALATHEPIIEANDNSDPPSQTDQSKYRDSAINVSDSPVISEEVPLHRSVRDSGYPETESSPILASEPQYQNTGSVKNLDDPYARRSQQDEQEYDQSYRAPERRRSTPPPIVAVGADPDYDVSVSNPRERQRRSRSYDSDDSADSGFDIQRRRRHQAMAREAREPSPVSSTTKDRSSALFNSSPSAREEVLGRPHEELTSARDDSIRQEPTWSFGPQDSPPSENGVVPTLISPPRPSQLIPDQGTYDDITGTHGESSASLFGGPFRQDEDIKSESRSPPSSEVRRRRQHLNTISEDCQAKLSLHAKDKHTHPDVGSPEAGVEGRRMRSPPVTDDASSYVSTTALNSYQPGPAVDEERPLDDLGGSRGRNTEQISNHHTDLSNLPKIPPKQREGELRTASTASMQSDNSIRAIIRTPDQVRSASGQSYRSSGTPPLRRVDRSVSSDLRGASKLGEAKLRAKTSEAELNSGVNIPSSSTYDPVTDKGKSRADMTDVYVSLRSSSSNNSSVLDANANLQEGWGDVRGQSPLSPTRPPSMRKRQSMQLLDLETRLDQLVSENRLLQSQKSTAERTLQEQTRDHSQQRHAYQEALEEHKMFLAQKDSQLDELREIVKDWQNKVAHLTEVNEGLIASKEEDNEHNQRYRELEAEYLHLKERHLELTTGMETLVQREVASHLEAKNSELQRLRDELESAKQQVRTLQQQLLASRESGDFVERDEDYFESQCQSLCQHVQQWVLRFSKFSDMKACYRASEIRDETKLDRMENAILDGTDVDIYLQDRVKRRDVFMAVVMTMIFEYIFTRYLFGMDREQRQKLKNLEKTLQEIGPMSAVCKWRATTLTLLMKREAFARQRITDTEAIVQEIYDTLATFLPPPSHLVAQIQDSLRKVINSAADLSIEMRTQRADYQMLPPLQPDYDTNGDLAQKVYFNALTMNERSGATTSNQALQEQGAVVRMVLFPLVVKNEEDDEQIIVCPAQVLTADSKARKTVRVMSVQGSTQGGRSEASFAGSEGGMF